jgi:hypothetical protein
MRFNGDRFTTCHDSIPLVILVKRGHLGGIFEMPLVPLGKKYYIHEWYYAGKHLLY